MADHDQRFKVLIQEFLGEFLDLFLPEGWSTRFLVDQAEWLDQEAFPDPPSGERRSLDLVAKLPVTEPVELGDGRQYDHELALIHIEVESSESVPGFSPRLAEYYDYLRNKYDLPVLPIALFLFVGKQGLGWQDYVERFWGEEIRRTRYRFVGLPALDGERYLEGENPLGVALASLMRLPSERRAELKARAMRRVADASVNELPRYFLMGVIETYLKLDTTQQEIYDRLTETEEMQDLMKTWNPWEEKGEQRGRVEGHRELIRYQLERKFGAIPEPVNARLDEMSPDELLELADKILTATSLSDLGFQ